MLQRLPMRGVVSPVSRCSAALGPSIARIGSISERSITWPAPSPTSTARSAVSAASAPYSPANASAMANGGTTGGRSA